MNTNQEEELAKWEHAFNILKEVVREIGLKDVSEYKGEILNQRWQIFKREHPHDVSLVLLVSGLYGTLEGDFFLLKGAFWIMEEVEKLLRQPHADKLFDLPDEESLIAAIDYHTRNLLNNYIHYLPAKMCQALDQALDDSVCGYIKNVIEPTFRTQWESLGLPDDFTLLPSDELQKYDKQLEELRKIFIGAKRPKLTAEQRQAMREEYQNLRLAYAEARRFHDLSRKTFFKNNPTSKDKDGAWREKWFAIHVEMFPKLRSECLQI